VVHDLKAGGIDAVGIGDENTHVAPDLTILGNEGRLGGGKRG
jgi:hypothetical protein